MRGLRGLGRHRIRHLALITTGFLVASSGVAYAYFSSTASGTYGLANSGHLVPATGFAATNVTTSGLTLSWTTPVSEPAGATVTGDAITQTGGSPAAGGSCFTADPTSPCSVTGLVASSTYTFTLTVFDHQWSATSAALQVTTTASATCDGTPTPFTLQPYSTYHFTIVGGGGGKGANGTPGGSGTGGAGAAGARLTGNLENTTAHPVTVDTVVGCAGQPALGNTADPTEAKGFGTGDQGGDGQNAGGGGGGSGGGTAIELATTSGTGPGPKPPSKPTTLLAAAGGGGGGGGALGSLDGGDASATYTTSSQSNPAPGTDGQNANCGGPKAPTSCAGSGAGGGGVAPGASAGTAGKTSGAPGQGGANGNSYVATTGTTVTGVLVTFTSTTPVAGANAGHNGSATITETAGPPSFTSAASTSFPTGTKSSFEVTTSGSPAPTVTNAGWASSTSPPGCTTSSYPAGLTITPHPDGTATIAATAAVPEGVYTFCLQAHNTYGTAFQAFTLDVVTAPLTFAAIGPPTTWAHGTAKDKPVSFPATVTPADGDLLLLVVVGTQDPGTGGKLAGWHTGDLGGNGAGGTHPHAAVFWRQHTTSTTSVSVTPGGGNPSAAAWVVAYKVTGTLAVATSDTCGAGSHVSGRCGYASASPTLTLPAATNVTTSHATAVEISIGTVIGANTLSLSTPNGFTFEGTKKVTLTSGASSANGDAIGVADEFVAASKSRPTEPVWHQSGTAATWAWATLAFDPPPASPAASAPAVTSVSPGTGPAGTRVTITGTHLAGATEVLFGTVPASFTLSGTTIIAIAPAGPAGPSGPPAGTAVTVTVVGAAAATSGTGSTGATFLYTATPTATPTATLTTTPGSGSLGSPGATSGGST